MRRTTLFLSTLFVAIAFTACKGKKVIENPQATLELKFEMTSGTNGMAVAYNPKKKLYYAVIGGNTDYPLEVFDKNGNRLSGNAANIDTRGIWWNSKLNHLEANTYKRRGEATVLNLKLDDKGYYTGETIKITNNDIQPDGQAVGAYDFKNDHILFYSYGKVYKAGRASLDKIGNIKLQLPVSKSYINKYAIIYTGFPKKEVGVLDHENKKVYLFNVNTGEHTQTINLPSNAETPERFKFSYANGYVWLYSVKTRSWKGYKIMK
jgi:hypothetical protein